MPARKKKMLELAGSGDDGSTGLLGGGRAPKDDPRIEAYGTIDEASSAVGLAKSLSPHPRVRSICEELQRGLYTLGAELATNPDSSASFAKTTKEQVGRLDALIAELEQSVKLDPRADPVNYYVLGVAQHNSSHFREASTAFRKCAEFKGNLQETCKDNADKDTTAAAAPGNTAN